MVSQSSLFVLVGRMWGWLTRTQHRYENAQALIRARVVMRLSDVFGLVALLGVLYTLTLTGAPDGSRITLLAGISLAVAALVSIALVQSGRDQIAGLILLLILLIAVIAAALPFGFSSATVLGLAVPLILGSFLFGRSALAAITILLAAVVLGWMLITALTPGAAGTGFEIGTAFIVILILGVNSALLAAFPNANTGLTGARRLGANLDLIIKSSHILSEYPDWETLLDRVGEELGALLGYYYVQLFTFDPNVGLFVRTARVSALSQALRVERRIAANDLRHPVAIAARQRSPLLVPIDAEAALRQEFLEATRAELLLPLRKGEQVLGILDVHSAALSTFDANEIELLEAIGGQVAGAMVNQQEAETLHRTGAERQRLQEQVERLTRDMEQMRLETSIRTWQDYFARRGQNVVGFDWQNKDVSPSTKLTPSLAHALGDAMPQLRMDGNDQLLTIPIVVRNQTLGVMEFRAVGNTPWGEHHLELARLIGGRLSVMLDNARLIEQTQTAVFQERLISDVTGQMQTQLDLESLLATAANLFTQALSASSVHIQLAPPETSLPTFNLPPTNGNSQGSAAT